MFCSWQILRNRKEWRAARTSASSSVGRAFFLHRGQKLGNLNSRATKKPLELVRWTSSGLSPLSFPPKSTREDPSHSNVRGYGHECSWIHAGARRWTHRGLSTRMRVLAVVPRKAVETRGNYHPCALVKVSPGPIVEISPSFPFPFFSDHGRSWSIGYDGWGGSLLDDLQCSFSFNLWNIGFFVFFFFCF